MKLKLFLPLTIAVLWSGTVWGATAGGAAHTTGVFNFSLPSIECDIQDLDARDSDNNSITSIDEQQGLKDIFLSGLFSLLLQTELYTYARATEILAKKLGLDAHSFAAFPLAAMMHAMEILCNAGFWKNVVTALAAAFMFVLLKHLLRCTPASLLSSIRVTTAPVVFRC